MEAQLNKILLWLDARGQRERLILLATCLFAIYFLWNVIISSPLGKATTQIETEQQKVELLNKTTEKEIRILTSKQVKTPSPELIQEYNTTKAQLDKVTTQLEIIKQKLVSSAKLVSEIKSLFDSNQELALTRLEDLTTVQPSSQPVINTPPVKKPNEKISEALAKTPTTEPEPRLQQHDFILEFHGDYFSSIKYLQALAALPVQFFWTELIYEVKDYPDAQVTLKLHTRVLN
jgi:MSHA biogenesis protein MshJ